ncbi:MAG TPA: efflux RND transporter periplasmic adaptor subunit [Cyclobacteriaceae bacterium]
MLILLLMLIMASCGRHDHSTQEEVYTCPMHPTVVSNEPGACPVCGMDLVRKGGPGEELTMTPELSRVLKSPNETIVTSVKTIRPEFKSMPMDVNVNGVVTYDTRSVHTIPSRVAGRLEKVYITYVLQPVKAGQKVAEIYSPELSTAQRELIFLLENDPENNALIDASRRKLELLGMSASQINALTTNQRITSTVSIYSPYSGYVTVGTPPSLPQGDMKNGQNNEMNNSLDRLVRAGDYVSAGQMLFTIVDSKALRIELNVPGTTGYTVQRGTRAQLSIGGGKMQDVTIDFVEPFVSQGQPFSRLRVYFESGQNLRIGSLVSARIHIDMQESLWVPRESVVDLGVQQIVFVQQRNVFKPKVVQTGVRSEGMIEITGGLATSDEIAANAQFLIDSDSFVKPIN